MKQNTAARSSATDLTACEQEPIHIPGSIQPYGFLLALAPTDLRILQASANAESLFGRAVDEVLGQPIDAILPKAVEALRPTVLDHVPEHGAGHVRSIELEIGGERRRFDAVAHRSGGALILELETAPDEPASFEDIHPVIRTFVEALQGAATVEDMSQLVAQEVRRITGFDRVLIYRFDEHWNGTVIAEDRNEALPSYLDLRFPASDIPRQARELYRLNRLRLIADAGYRPVPIVPAINPLAGQPLDLSLSVLRSVSPVHIEYMRNMGTAASMSISILHDGELWGLISCHNKEPRRVALPVRSACDFIGQIMSLQLAAKDRSSDMDNRIRLGVVQSKLLAFMAEEEHFVDGLAKHPDELLQLAGADGAAVVFGGSCFLIGRTPSDQDVRRIVDWLAGSQDQEDLFRTNCLSASMPGAEALKDVASGVLAIAISQIHASYVLWFRPEAIQTVHWGGDPSKPAATPFDGRLHPRKSFETWKETVRLEAVPWKPSEIDAVRGLRTAIVDIVLRKAEELAELTQELERSNRELEAFSYSVSHDLRAPFRHIVGYSELLREEEGANLSERGRRFVDTIIESAFSAGRLVDDLLSFSRMGRTTLMPMTVDMGQIVAEARRRLEPETVGRRITWRVGPLERVWADPAMLRLAVENLLSNAIKYTRPREEAVIELGTQRGEGETIFFVRDNGIGFDMTYIDKLFGVFQRLHRMEDFEGTGIGLANVRRIIERHGGRVWAEGVVDAGAAFYLTLPDLAEAE